MPNDTDGRGVSDAEWDNEERLYRWALWIALYGAQRLGDKEAIDLLTMLWARASERGKS